jgi:(4-(4-[2-(gamma-L-glutamylamino)ethyl]phenoxymethyl)furan-2-yl)methanamine synthase
MLIAGLDIGGVNIKVAVCRIEGGEIQVEASSFPFECAGDAEHVLRRLLGPAERIVATETVSFSRSQHRTYAEGVGWVCDLLERSFDPTRVRFVAPGFRLVPVADARTSIWSVACRNWIATSYLAVASIPNFENGILVDCGTSSLDVIPVVDGEPLLLDGEEDQVWTRLGTGELTLTGTLLTSVQSLAPTIDIRGRTFATRSNSACLTGHARIVAGEVRVSETVPGHSDDTLSHEASRRALAELVGADASILDEATLQAIAHSILTKQRAQVAQQVRRVIEAAERSSGRSLERAILAGLGNRLLLEPALRGHGLTIERLDDALDDWLLPGSTLEANCETALGALLMGVQSLHPTLPGSIATLLGPLPAVSC